MSELSFPFRMYPLIPRGPFIPPFLDTRIYLTEALELYAYLKDEPILPETLNLFIIGSLLDDSPDHFGNHYQQHLPEFVLNFAETNPQKNVNIIVISPSKNEKIEFIKRTQKKYDWINQKSRTFISGKITNLKYTFFQCPVPEYVGSDFIFRGQYYNQKDSESNARLNRFFAARPSYRKLLNLTSDRSNNWNFTFKSRSELSGNDRNFFDQVQPQFKESLTNDKDIDFVSDFYSALGRFLKRTNLKGGANLCLNYAVFNENWAGVSAYYFLETFYKKFQHRVLFLTYEFKLPPSTSLINIETSQIYSYTNKQLVLEFTKENPFLKIISEGSRKYRVKSKENYNDNTSFSEDVNENSSISEDVNEVVVNDKVYTIKPVPGDGNCMFKAILDQIDTDMSILELREKTVSYIKQNMDMIDEIKRNIRGEGIYTSLIDRWTRQGKSQEFINQNIIDLYFYFMSRLPTDPEAERKRLRYRLPLTVYYGGTIELQAMANILKYNINVIEGEGANSIITSYNSSNTEIKGIIYLISRGRHIDIAIPTRNKKLLELSDEEKKKRKKTKFSPYKK